MNTKNIAALVGMLSRAGFEQSIGHRLLQQVCFKPVSFTLTEKLLKGKDVLTCTLYFERKNDDYTCLCYDAAFIKEVVMPDRVIISINLRELDNTMSAIDWQMKNTADQFRLDDEQSWVREKNIEQVVNDLSRLSATEDGKIFADCLKVKYWAEAGLETLVGNLSALKSRMEVSQRFYFMDGEGIAVDEAFRFLLNRWMEKKMLAKRRQEDSTEGKHTREGGEGLEKKLLLKKRRNRNIRKKL